MTASKRSESEIRHTVRQIQRGDRELFRIIIAEYKPLVIHVVYRLIRQAQDREDLCQETFVRVYTHLGSFRFESKLSTWIARIAYNTCINFLQKKGEVLMTDTACEDQPEFERVSDVPLPDEACITEDTMRLVEAAVGRLNPVFRAIVTLYHLEHMSYEEIAKTLSLPQGTVKSYLYRARQQLKTILEPIYAGDQP
ncbi:sigma-70 family RNA polymerase sigma factor [bacterium]|nr:sigma-70 family RNA polymerase sigma factor [bacterium]